MSDYTNEIENVPFELSDELHISVQDLLKTDVVTDEDRENYKLNKETSLEAAEFLDVVGKLDFNE